MPAPAQEGHPLTGTWYGEFETNDGRRDLTVVMDWDGLQITGIIDPGPDSAPIMDAEVNVSFAVDAPPLPNAAIRDDASPDAIPPTFSVRFEADLRGEDGASNRCVFEGTILNPVAGNRRIVGIRTCGREEGDFSIQRL